MLVLNLHGYRIAWGVTFIIKSGGGFETAVGIESEKWIVVFSVYEVIGDRIPIRVGSIELADDRTDGLVFLKGEHGGRI